LNTVTALCFLAAAYSAALGGRTELAYQRPGDPGATGLRSEESFTWDSSLGAGLLADFQGFQLSLGYIPRYTLRDFTNQPDSALLHGAELSALWEWPRVTLKLSESAAYGERSFFPLSTDTQPTTTSRVALDGRVSYVSTDTTLTSALQLSHRVLLSFSTSYFVTGGTDESSRELFPLARGTRSNATFDYAASRNDNLLTALNGTYQTSESSFASEDVEASVFVLSEGWKRRWSRATHSELQGGAGLSWVSLAEKNPSFFPHALFSVTHLVTGGSGGDALELSANAGISKAIDQLTGTTDNRADVGASAVLTLPPVALFGAVTHGVSVGSSERDLTLTTGTLALRVELLEGLTAETGVRVVDQSVADAGPQAQLAVDGLTWALFMALEYRPEAIPIN
jgi:hypothetical protein